MKLELLCQRDSLVFCYFHTAGPIVGGPLPPGDRAPRAVNEDFFNRVCPYDRRKFIDIQEVNNGLKTKPTLDYLKTYVKLLSELPDGCVELRGGWDHPFDWM